VVENGGIGDNPIAAEHYNITDVIVCAVSDEHTSGDAALCMAPLRLAPVEQEALAPGSQLPPGAFP
jgi:hypothetical protein